MGCPAQWTRRAACLHPPAGSFEVAAKKTLTYREPTKSAYSTPPRPPSTHVPIQLSDPIRRSQVRDGPPRAGAGGDVAELQGWGAGFIVACFFFTIIIVYRVLPSSTEVNYTTKDLNWAKTSSLLWTLMDPQKGCTRLWFAAKPLFPGVSGHPRPPLSPPLSVARRGALVRAARRTRKRQFSVKCSLLSSRA